MLGQRPGDGIGQRENLRRPEARRLGAADARELADDLLEPALSRKGRREPQRERNQPAEGFGNGHRFRAALADLGEDLEGLAFLRLVDRDVRRPDRCLHPVRRALEAVRAGLDHHGRHRRRGGSRLVLLGADADVQHLLALAAVTEHGDAETAELPRQPIGAGDIGFAGAVGQVDRLRHAIVGGTLERGLVPDVPLEADLMRGLEDLLGRLGDARNAVDGPAAGDLLHQCVGEPALVSRDRLERLVDEGQHALTVGLLDPMLEGQGEDGFDARRAPRDHRDRAGGRDRGDGGVPHRPRVLVDRLRPVRKRPAFLGQLGRLVVRLLLDEGHQAIGEVGGFLAVVRHAEQEQHVGPAHDAEADPPVVLHGLVDHRQRVRVHLDDVVQETHGEPHHALHLVPVDRHLTVLGPPRELGDVERAEIARLVRQQGLLAARIGRLDLADLRRRVGRARVDPIEEDHPGIARAPGRRDDPPEDLARRELAHDRARVRIDQVVILAALEGLHEAGGGRDRDVEVGDATVQLALDELEDVGVIDLEDPHVGAASGAALLHGLRRAVEHAQERDGAGRATAGRGDEVVLRAQAGERESRPAAALVNDRRGLHGVEDLLHGVAHGQHVAGRVLKPVALARVHERGRVRQELALHHHVVEGLRDLTDRCRGASVPRFARRNGRRHPPAHFLRRLRHLAVLPAEVTLAEHSPRGLGPLTDLRRTGFRQHPDSFLSRAFRGSFAVGGRTCFPEAAARQTTISCGRRKSSTQNLGVVK